MSIIILWNLSFKIYVPMNMTTQGQHTCQVNKQFYKKKYVIKKVSNLILIEYKNGMK